MSLSLAIQPDAVQMAELMTEELQTVDKVMDRMRS